MPRGSEELTRARREEIVSACAALYETMSFGEVTIAAIAAETTFTRTSIYNYFRTKEEIFRSPKHPYTWALLDSIPSRSLPRKSRLYSLKGTPPNLSLPIEGCPFAARCRYCMPVCRKCAPQPTDFSPTHQASCWLNHPMAPQHVREGGSR